jgi:outer membrane protein
MQRIHLVPLALVIATATASAQPPARAPLPVRVTLDEAVARALATSHRLAELRAREGASQAVIEQRRLADWPSLSAQAGYMRTNHVPEFGVPAPDGTLNVFYPYVPDNYRTRLDLLWPIYTGGRSEALERAARAEASAATSDTASSRADLRLEVTRAFWALVTATESVRVVGESTKRLAAQRRDVQARYDAGFVAPSDVLSVQAQEARQQGALIEVGNIRDVARADLARLIGVPLDHPLEPDAVLADEPAGSLEAAALAATVEMARRQRADREALASRASAAAERIDAARAASRPTINIASGVDYANPNPRIFPRAEKWQEFWDVGVTVSWLLWNGGRTAAEVTEASKLAEAARERLAEFDTTIAFEVRQRQLDLESARAQASAANAGVKSAAEAQRVMEERFKAGVETSTDLLDRQVALLQAELDRTRVLASIKLAQARLARALGF